MKILLIQPPVEDFYITSQRTFPLGLLYIAGSLKKNGFEPHILDCITGIKPEIIELDEELEYLKKIYTVDFSPARLFHNYYRFGYSAAQLEEIIKAEKYDCYCISSNFTAYYKTALETASIIRKNHPTATVIGGGYNARIMYDSFLKSGNFDYIIFFEGENTIIKLLKNLDKPAAVNNIAFLRDDRIIKTAGKSDFDFNDCSLSLEFIETDKYRIGRDKLMTLMTSRGCPYNCEFCTVNNNVSGSYKIKNIELLKNELKSNILNYGIRALDIEDDNFGIDENYFYQICSFIRNELPDLKLYCMNGLHYMHLNRMKIRALKNAGLKNLNISMVNSSGLNINRPTDLKKLGEVIEIALDENLNVTVYFILGLPEQTIESLIEIINF